MELFASATHGDRCSNERHLFRIGVDSTAATEFTATREEFPDALNNAYIDHAISGRPGRYALYLQVWTTASAKWRNVQNPATGGVIAVTPRIAGEITVADTLFTWACDSVQMLRDLDILAGGLAREAITIQGDGGEAH